MKKKEKTSIGSKSHEELSQQVVDLTKEINALHVDRYTKEQKNTRVVRELKKKKARILTARRMLELGGKI